MVWTRRNCAKKAVVAFTTWCLPNLSTFSIFKMVTICFEPRSRFYVFNQIKRGIHIETVHLSVSYVVFYCQPCRVLKLTNIALLCTQSQTEYRKKIANQLTFMVKYTFFFYKNKNCWYLSQWVYERHWWIFFFNKSNFAYCFYFI